MWCLQKSSWEFHNENELEFVQFIDSWLMAKCKFLGDRERFCESCVIAKVGRELVTDQQVMLNGSFSGLG